MRGLNRSLRACLVLALLLGPVRARAAYEDVGVGARVTGLGHAYTAVADDAYAVYYNPAGLGFLDRPELSTTYSRLLTGLSDGTNLQNSFLTYARPIAGGRKGDYHAIRLKALKEVGPSVFFSLLVIAAPNIDHQGHLPRLAKEVLLDEQVVGRQKDAQARMRVLPAEQRFGRKIRLDLARQAGPRIVVERQGSGASRGFQRRMKVANDRVQRIVAVHATQQETAALPRRVLFREFQHRLQHRLANDDHG